MDQVKVLVVYDSMTGNVESMANAVAEGVFESGGSVDVMRVDDVDMDAILTYDGFAFGSPTHCGTISVKMNEFFNQKLHSRYWGKLDNKVAVAFTSSGGLGGGNEITLMSLISVILNFGMTSFGVTNYVSKEVTLHYGAVAIQSPSSESLEACKLLGKKLVSKIQIIKTGLKTLSI